MKIALAQLQIEAGDRAGNVDRADTAIGVAADRGADLVVLPELFNVGFFAFDAYADAAEPIDGPTHQRLTSTAVDHDVGLLAGSIVEDLEATAATTDVPVPAASGLANTAVLYDRDGTRRLTYRKTHLWGYQSREAELLVPGESIDVVDFEGFTVGATTCYDLRFPELYRTLLEQDVSLILVPSAWPYPRVEHWRTLSRARAVENLSYVATVNGAGAMGETTLCGRSTVYDPWGTTLASTADDPDLVLTEIAPDRVATVRAEFPAVRDRRTRDFYVS